MGASKTHSDPKDLRDRTPLEEFRRLTTFTISHATFSYAQIEGV
jgi:hypothetical protein